MALVLRRTGNNIFKIALDHFDKYDTVLQYAEKHAANGEDVRAALTKACQRKLRETSNACCQEGLVVLPFATETLGVLHCGAVTQVRQIVAAHGRSKRLQEGEVTGQLFGRLSLTLMQGNALMLSSRFQENSLVPSQVDGVM